MDDWDNYTTHAWGWDWLYRAWVEHPAIRPSDRDGFVHLSGKLLFIDGKVVQRMTAPPIADQIMIDKTTNVTCLYLRHPPDLWNEDHEPRNITHYYLRPGPFPGPSWAHNAWVPTTVNQVKMLCLEWAMWAYLTGLDQEVRT